MAENAPSNSFDYRATEMFIGILDRHMRPWWLGTPTHCNPANLRLDAGLNLGFESTSIEGAAKSPKEAELLDKLNKRQRGQGFGVVGVTRYAPGQEPKTFYRS